MVAVAVSLFKSYSKLHRTESVLELGVVFEHDNFASRQRALAVSNGTHGHSVFKTGLVFSGLLARD